MGFNEALQESRWTVWLIELIKAFSAVINFQEQGSALRILERLLVSSSGTLQGAPATPQQQHEAGEQLLGNSY